MFPALELLVLGTAPAPDTVLVTQGVTGAPGLAQCSQAVRQHWECGVSSSLTFPGA